MESAPLVLIVEDSPDVRRVATVVLRRDGYRTAEAEHGQQALNMLRAGLRPAAILLDLAMPVMDGRSFRAAQLEDPALRAIPVVVYSAFDAAALPGVFSYVQKGEPPAALRAAMRRAVGPP